VTWTDAIALLFVFALGLSVGYRWRMRDEWVEHDREQAELQAFADSRPKRKTAEEIAQSIHASGWRIAESTPRAIDDEVV